MKRVRIRIVPPSVDEQTALRLVNRYRGKLLWQKEEVVGVELVFVPYHLFRYRIRPESEPGKVGASGVMAVDAVRGIPVLLEGERIAPRTATVNEEVVYQERLDRRRAAEAAGERAPELLGRTVRSARRPGRLDIEFLDSLYLPHWIGVYRRKGKSYYGVVIDGNRPAIAPGVLEIITAPKTPER